MTVRRNRWVWAVATLVVLVTASPASAGTIVANSAGAITINDAAKATPFPSSIAISGADGPIADVNVRMTISHAFPDDVEIALQAPDGDMFVIMIDVCGSAALTNANLTFDSDAAAALPGGGPCSPGTFRPSFDASNGGWDFTPAPNPANDDLGSLDGENPIGTWRLFVQDDAGGQTGSISSWGLTIETATGDVTIPGSSTSGPGSPYPSTKNFSTPEGEVITDADLQIRDLSHSRPDDVGLLLQSPGATAALVMGNACGSTVMNNVDVRFDDEAAAPFADEGPCTGPSRKPSVFGVTNLLTPAPAGPYAQTLSVFDGLSGGDWRLWANDDDVGETGYIGEWEMVLQTRLASATGFAATTATATEGQSAALTVVRGAPATGPATIDVGIIHGDTDLTDIGTAPTQLTFARGETSKTLTIPITADVVGEGPETFNVALANAIDDARLEDATSFATVTIDRSDADNRFTLGKAKRRGNGTARIPVMIPNPGKITTRDAGNKALVRRTTIFAEAPGTVVVKVRPARKAKRKLRRGQKVKTNTEVVYTPVEGKANSTDTKVTLKLKP